MHVSSLKSHPFVVLRHSFLLTKPTQHTETKESMEMTCRECEYSNGFFLKGRKYNLILAAVPESPDVSETSRNERGEPQAPEAEKR